MKVFVTVRQLAHEPSGLKEGPFGLTLAVCGDAVTDRTLVTQLPVQYKSRKRARRAARNIQAALRDGKVAV